jgi:cell cycle sensor histidine kinase DivJ
LPTEPPAIAEPSQTDQRRLALWHGGVALGACLLLTGGLVVGPSPGLAVRAALAVMIVPALLGALMSLRHVSRRDRLMILGAWGLAAASASALSGGMSGPLTGLMVLPVAAGLLLGGASWGLAGAMLGLSATAIAVLVGLFSVWIAGAAAGAPVLSSATALLAVAATAVSLRWAWRDRDEALTGALRTLRRTEDLAAAQPGLTLLLTPQGGLAGSHGRPTSALDLASLAGQGLIAFTHAPDRPQVQEGLARALALPADAEPVQVVLTPREALDRRVILYVRRMEPSAGPLRLIAQAYDGTAQFAREHALETARAEAVARDAGKTRFLANMSHELRTPLNAVLGFADIMRTRLFGPLPDRYAEYASSIHEAGGHLLNLINDVLDVSKIEADRYELSRERFDAREAVSAAVALVRMTAEDKGVALQAVMSAEPVTVNADRRALQQISLNLLSNAVKFTPSGGSVTATLTPVGPYLELIVADTGVGVAPEDLKRLGRPFEQAGGSEQRAQGTGLGLSLVRSLAELHGGRMNIESTLGEGTAVTIRLPVVVMERAAEPVADDAPSAEIIPLRPEATES